MSNPKQHIQQSDKKTTKTTTTSTTSYFSQERKSSWSASSASSSSSSIITQIDKHQNEFSTTQQSTTQKTEKTFFGSSSSFYPQRKFSEIATKSTGSPLFPPKKRALSNSELQRILTLDSGSPNTAGYRPNGYDDQLDLIECMPSSTRRTLAVTKTTGPGKLYIFNHTIFQEKKLTSRQFSDIDVANLRKAFSKFNVTNQVFPNYTVAMIKQEMKKISEIDFRGNSCVVFAILTHGFSRDVVYAYDDKYYIHNDIILNLLKNTTLKNKKIIFLVQACRGDIDPRSRSYLHTDAHSIPPDNIFMFYSTFEGFVSFGSSSGSIFITSFCEIFTKYGATENFNVIVKKVQDDVKNNLRSKQIPSTAGSTNLDDYCFGEYMCSQKSQ